MTETQTVDLAEWLTRIWDEEERLAKAALGYEISDHDGPFLRHAVDYLGPELADHIAYHDPASVLARIAADRKILELHRIDVRNIDHPPFDELTGERWPDQYDVICRVCGWAAEDPTSACETVRLLASPYADRPGFREEWR